MATSHHKKKKKKIELLISKILGHKNRVSMHKNSKITECS